MILLMHDSFSVIAETLAEEVCQGGAAADASDPHAAASSSDHESGNNSPVLSTCQLF